MHGSLALQIAPAETCSDILATFISERAFEGSCANGSHKASDGIEQSVLECWEKEGFVKETSAESGALTNRIGHSQWASNSSQGVFVSRSFY